MVQRQLHLALNATRYRPLLDALRQRTILDCPSDSALIGVWLFVAYRLVYQRNAKGETRSDILIREWCDGDALAGAVAFCREYEQFLKDGTLPR